MADSNTKQKECVSTAISKMAGSQYKKTLNSSTETGTSPLVDREFSLLLCRLCGLYKTLMFFMEKPSRLFLPRSYIHLCLICTAKYTYLYSTRAFQVKVRPRRQRKCHRGYSRGQAMYSILVKQYECSWPMPISCT